MSHDPEVTRTRALYEVAATLAEQYALVCKRLAMPEDSSAEEIIDTIDRLVLPVPIPAEPGLLDDAWKAAEAALPDGVWIVASGNERLGYNVLAYQMAGTNEIGTVFEIAKAPAGPLVPALDALRAALSESGKGETE